MYCAWSLPILSFYFGAILARAYQWQAGHACFWTIHMTHFQGTTNEWSWFGNCGRTGPADSSSREIASTARRCDQSPQPNHVFFSSLHCSHFTHWITGILRLRDETQRVCLSVAFALIACFVSEMSLERFYFALQCINGMYGQQLFARRWPWPLIYVEQLQRHQSISNQPSAIHLLEQLSEKYLHFILLIVSSDLQSIWKLYDVHLFGSNQSWNHEPNACKSDLVLWLHQFASGNWQEMLTHWPSEHSDIVKPKS